MKEHTRLIKTFGFLLIAALLFAVLPVGEVRAADPVSDRETVILSAADWIVDHQNVDGGFPWILPSTTSTTNTLGVTAIGVLKAHSYEEKTVYEESLAKAYDYVVNNVPLYEWDGTKYTDTAIGIDSFPDFTFLIWLAELAQTDSTLLAAINDIQESDINAVDIANLAKSRWDNMVLKVGSTQQASPNGTATLMAQRIRDKRHAANQDSLIPWDLEAAVKAALALDGYFSGQGYAQQAVDIAAVIYNVIDDDVHFSSTDKKQTDYVIGLTGAIEAFVEVNDYSASVDDLKAKLLDIQQPDGSWKWHDATDPADWSIQSTAYAVMALNAQGDEDALTAARKGADFLVKNQTTDGGWLAETDWLEKVLEVDSEATWALATLPAPVTIGGLGYYSIQSAIDAASDGNTINVGIGNYVENGQIVINKNLTIDGEDKETTIIKPAQDTGSSGDSRGWFLVTDGVNFNLSNVTLDGEGKQVHQAIRSFGSGTIDNNIIKNITYGSYYGLGAVMMGDYNMTFSNNTLSNIGRIGMMAYGSGVTDAQIIGNIYTGKGDGDWLDYGIEIGGGAVAHIEGNTIAGIGESTTDWSSAAIMVTDAYPTNGPASVTIVENILKNNYRGIHVGYGDSDGVIVEAKRNNLAGTTRAIVTTTDLINLVDGSPNWFGSITGPDDQIVGNVEFAPWCGDEACSFTVPDENGVIEIPAGASGDVVQQYLNNAPEGTIIKFLGSPGSFSGGFEINNPGLTINLNGATIGAGSPAFTVTADNTIINGPGVLDGTGDTENSPAILVKDPDGESDGVFNFTVSGLEIKNWANGIYYEDAITNTQIVDNYIHDLSGDGIFFAEQPIAETSVSFYIQGNLFDMANIGGFGVNAPDDLDVTYNSWGSKDGPVSGDDLPTDITLYDPFTHVDLDLQSSGTFYANQVVKGDEIVYEVYGNLANIQGAEFTLTFPSDKLSYKDGSFENHVFDEGDIDDSVSEKLSIHGYQYPEAGGGPTNSVSVENTKLFSVTFIGEALGKDLEIGFEAGNFSFAHYAGDGGPTNHVYAAELLGVNDLLVFALPTMSSDDLEGPYIAGISREFKHRTTNPLEGRTYDQVIFKFTIWDADPSDIHQFQVLHLGNWIDLPLIKEGDHLVGEFGHAPVGFTMVAGHDAETTFRATFNNPGDYDVTIQLIDLFADPDWVLVTDEYVANVLGDFTVTGTVSMQGRTVRSGVPLTLTDIDGAPLYGSFDATSTSEDAYNVLFTGVNGSIYEITTLQPRYLNVHEGLNKQFLVDSDEQKIEALELKGGNAYWRYDDGGEWVYDNVIDIQDASAVGSDYGSTLDIDADVNFDGVVNIQDLALVGGNYNLTSAVAYDGWTP